MAGFRFIHTIQCTLLQGLLRGYDQTNNLVIEDCHERVFSATVRGVPGAAVVPFVVCVVRQRGAWPVLALFCDKHMEFCAGWCGSGAAWAVHGPRGQCVSIVFEEHGLSQRPPTERPFLLLAGPSWARWTRTWTPKFNLRR